MLIVYLLWITVVFGGLFMGLGAIREMTHSGFDAALALNTVLYLGCSLFGMPKLIKLVLKRG